MARGETYEDFVAKFKRNAPKTTDDCYTPQPVYEAVKAWLHPKTSLHNYVRPFYPGGDYRNFDYSESGTIVLDNPPFSIITEIVDFYIERDVPFFLFCNGLTAIQLLTRGRNKFVTLVLTNTCIAYENGAKVRTCFATNLKLSGDNSIILAGDLTERINSVRGEQKIVKKRHEPNKKNAGELFKYIPPRQDISIYYDGVFRKDSNGVEIFGGGVGLSDDTIKTLDQMRARKEGVDG